MTRTQDLGIHSHYFCIKSECLIPSKNNSVRDQIAYPDVTYALTRKVFSTIIANDLRSCPPTGLFAYRLICFTFFTALLATVLFNPCQNAGRLMTRVQVATDINSKEQSSGLTGPNRQLFTECVNVENTYPKVHGESKFGRQTGIMNFLSFSSEH